MWLAAEWKCSQQEEIQSNGKNKQKNHPAAIVSVVVAACHELKRDKRGDNSNKKATQHVALRNRVGLLSVHALSHHHTTLAEKV